MKRLIDLLVACMFIAFTLPLTAIVALAIKLESPGPIFYRHPCLDHSGRRIEILKFRTTLHQAQYGGATYRRGASTRIGWFLRYTRIEDLPQLVDVLRGELTLFGDGSNHRDRPKFWP